MRNPLPLQPILGNQRVKELVERPSASRRTDGHANEEQRRGPVIRRQAGPEEEPSPEEDFLYDLESGIKDAESRINYISDTVDWWLDHPTEVKPKGLTDAAEDLLTISRRTTQGLAKARGIIDKAKTFLEIRSWAMSIRDFADKTQRLSLDNMEEWLESARTLGKSTEPFIESTQDWLKGLAANAINRPVAASVAARASLVLSVVTAYGEVGFAAVEAMGKITKQRIERIDEIIKEAEKGSVKEMPSKPPPEPGPLRATAAEIRESERLRQERAKRRQEREAEAERLRLAKEAFDEKYFPTRYRRRHRRRISWQLRREVKRFSDRKDLSHIRAFSRWWDCFAKSGADDRWDPLAGRSITPIKQNVSPEEAEFEIGNFKLVRPACPIFDRIYSDDFATFSKDFTPEKAAATSRE